MKKVEAVINQRAFQAVRELLIAQGHEIIVSEVVSADHGGGRTLHYRGVEYHRDEERLKIETVVHDADAMPVARSILSVSSGLDSSEHTVSVSHLENVLSIGITKLENQPLLAPSPVAARARTQQAERSGHALAV
jgi:nitrogen regulatory protein PII